MGALDRNPYTPLPFLREAGPGSINIVIYFKPTTFTLFVPNGYQYRFQNSTKANICISLYSKENKKQTFVIEQDGITLTSYKQRHTHHSVLKKQQYNT